MCSESMNEALASFMDWMRSSVTQGSTTWVEVCMRRVHHRPPSHTFSRETALSPTPQPKWVHLDHGTLSLVDRINLKNQLEERGTCLAINDMEGKEMR